MNRAKFAQASLIVLIFASIFMYAWSATHNVAQATERGIAILLYWPIVLVALLLAHPSPQSRRAEILAVAIASGLIFLVFISWVDRIDWLFGISALAFVIFIILGNRWLLKEEGEKA